MIPSFLSAVTNLVTAQLTSILPSALNSLIQPSVKLTTNTTKRY